MGGLCFKMVFSVASRKNKKGQGLSLTTIILIVLGLAVLVFLIFGFSKGWGSLWDTITQAGGGGANVDDVKRGCDLACSTQSKDAYCRESRKVNYGDGTWESGSCKTFETAGKPAIRIPVCSTSLCTGITAPKLGSSDATATKKKCGDLDPAGDWVKDDGCPSPKKDVTSKVGDDSDKGTNTVCCSD